MLPLFAQRKPSPSLDLYDVVDGVLDGGDDEHREEGDDGRRRRQRRDLGDQLKRPQPP